MRLRAALLSAAAFAALATPAWADAGWGDGVEVMSDADMSEHRGGFEIAGLDINFGAVVTTFSNGIPVLTTTLTWTDAGAIVDQTVGEIGQSIDDLTPDQITALGLDGLTGAGGVIIEDENGVTALVHNITEGALQNIIINNAAGRDLRQEIDVTLELPGFEAMQGALTTDLFGIHITDDMRGVMFYDPGG